MPFDQEWLLGMSLLADASAQLEDIDSARLLYPLLLPWSAFNAADHPEGARGAVARYLGLLARSMGRWTEAEQHFEDAMGIMANGRAAVARAHPERLCGSAVLAQRSRGP